MDVKQKNLGKSQVELEFELTAEEFQKHVDHALLHLKEHVKIDGFRPGQAPEKLVEEKIGNKNLLMEAGDLAVKESYSKYIRQLAEENNLEPISQPEVQILKIAKDNPFLFKVKISILPEIDLPDYKKTAQLVKTKEVFVNDQELNDALNYLQKSRAKFSNKEGGAEIGDFVEIEYQSKDIDNNKQLKDQFILGQAQFVKGFEDNLLGMKTGQEKKFFVKFADDYLRKDLAGKEISFEAKMISVKKVELPEISDDFARSLGSFNDLSALKNNIKEGIFMEKKEDEKQRKRAEILEEIVEKAKLEVPDAMIKYEEKKLMEDLKNKIALNMKITFEQYLAAVKKTEQEIEETFYKEAEKRLKGFLVLRQVGKKENVEVSDQELEQEVSKSIKNYSKEQLAKFDIKQLREYTKGAIFNEKVFQFLEKLSQ